ncbi:hypothetical protein [Nonomuraea guangzhouensis]|uniref:DUF4352 domain-containing protein n=1 Tax=Nonomuraea guangzhouensis TaxID=1291555 RepID=A0ABW4GWT1_9ACTN|nr:hypothetical protein [Nonomuraea guangzhouensis]
MATYPTVDIVRSGVAGSYTTVSASDQFSAGVNVFLHVKNTTGSAVTPTFVTPGKIAEMDISDLVGGTTPATTGERFYGPFPPNLFAAADGMVTVTWSASGAGITASALRVG